MTKGVLKILTRGKESKKSPKISYPPQPLPILLIGRFPKGGEFMFPM